MPLPIGSLENPLRVAVVGSGPAGFYTTEALFKSNLKVKVDMFDRLPTPFGLVRYGVAPDHPKIKNVIKVFEKTTENEGFSFCGNVEVGKDIAVDELRQFYDAIVFTYGAETDRKLGIPGEDLPGSHTATEFVAWYNGRPEYKDRKFDLSGNVAVIIGQGNVSMDVSRILCKSADELKNTDIAKHAFEVLAESKIKEVHLIGRRGPMQAAFTPPEIREFGEVTDCTPTFADRQEMELNEASQKEFDDPNFAAKRKNYEILKGFMNLPPASTKRKFFIHFLKSPVELKGNNKVEEVILEKNALFGPAGAQKAKATGVRLEMPCDIFFRSVGYRGIPIPGVPYNNERGNIPNQYGRVADNTKVYQGFYCAGWIKRGPSGVIGTNKSDADETVAKLMEDVPSLNPCPVRNSTALIEYLKGKKVRVVSFADWKKIDAAEMERGQKLGKPREKFVTIDEMLMSCNPA